MAIDLLTARALIEGEYANLVTALGMRRLPLDIYVAIEDTEDVTSRATSHGTDMHNGTPAYGRLGILLPLLNGDLGMWGADKPEFPPRVWDRHTDEWPMWRTELWHEVVHQYQDEILHKWDRTDRDGHGIGWTEAIFEVARHFGVTPISLLQVL
jgi:hypothetical protein